MKAFIKSKLCKFVLLELLDMEPQYLLAAHLYTADRAGASIVTQRNTCFGIDGGCLFKIQLSKT